MEALYRAYKDRGVSFYYVLSREPHPGFFGFQQTDSLENRRDMARLVRAELLFGLPWIIDDMQNTLQRTFGGMPNMEFVIARDGTLIYKRAWADPDALKRLLEERVGPSGITDEQWRALARQRPAGAARDSDEIPFSQVPWPELLPLNVSLVPSEGKEPPFTLHAASLPPALASGGQSRLYLTVRLAEGSEAEFYNARPLAIALSQANGLKFARQRLLAGRRRMPRDSFPRTLAVLWTRQGAGTQISFSATVSAWTATGNGQPRQWQAKFAVSGDLARSAKAADEVLPKQLPPLGRMAQLTCRARDQAGAPFSLRARIFRDPEHGRRATIYLWLALNEPQRLHWNNAAGPQEVALASPFGLSVDKELLRASRRLSEEDAEERILKLDCSLEPGAGQLLLEATVSAWLCDAAQGWCRRFSTTFAISGEL